MFPTAFLVKTFIWILIFKIMLVSFYLPCSSSLVAINSPGPREIHQIHPSGALKGRDIIFLVFICPSNSLNRISYLITNILLEYFMCNLSE